MMKSIKKNSKEPFYKVNVPYAITINPTDKYQYFGQMNRFKKWRAFMYENTIGLGLKYELFIEISEPRGMHTAGYSGPRLHCHGTIEFRNKSEIARFLLHDYYRLLRFASIDIDTINDLDYWRCYCTKQALISRNRLSSQRNIDTKVKSKDPKIRV